MDTGTLRTLRYIALLVLDYKHDPDEGDCSNAVTLFNTTATTTTTTATTQQIFVISSYKGYIVKPKNAMIWYKGRIRFANILVSYIFIIS
jgi:hypothetical protein